MYISTFDSIFKLMFICSCYDIYNYITMLVVLNYYGLINITLSLSLSLSLSLCMYVCALHFLSYTLLEGGGLLRRKGEREEFIYLNGFCFCRA